jgi:hypothetical protein
MCRSFGVESISKKKKKRSELVKEANKKSLETNLLSLEKKSKKKKNMTSTHSIFHTLIFFNLPYTYLLLTHGPKKSLAPLY